MLLREKLQPKLEPPKNLKPPNTNNELPITEKNHREDKRVLILIGIFIGFVLISSFFLPSEEIRYANTYTVTDIAKGDELIINDRFDQIRKDSRFVKLYLNFHNKGSKGRVLYDISIEIFRGEETNQNHLNGTYKEKFIQPTTDQLIFHDESPRYKDVKAILKIPASTFDTNSKISVIWAVGNPLGTKVNVIIHYVALAYLVLILLYFIKNIGFRSPEESITFALVIVAIVYVDPFAILKFSAPSRVYLVITKLLSNLFGGMLLFATQSAFALGRPCCAEIIEGNAVIGWIFFVVSAFFDVLPYFVSLNCELTFSLAAGVKTFRKVSSILCFFFGFSCFWTQKKEYVSVPENFKYRFWMIAYHCGILVIPFSLWKAVSIFTTIVSPTADDAIGVGMVVAACMSFACLFWNRSLCPLNLFHREDSKWKLE